MSEIAASRKPKVYYLGEEIDLDDLPSAHGTDPVENEDYFKPVRISGRAIDEALLIVGKEYWEKEGGIHAFLQKRAEWLFAKMPCSETKAKLRSLVYEFEYDAQGPILKSVKLVDA